MKIPGHFSVEINSHMPNMTDRDALVEWLIENRIKPASLRELQCLEGYINMWRPREALEAQKRRMANLAKGAIVAASA